MNIKISIKDCDCVQGITNNRQLSEVEHKKRTMLYAPPENDRNSNNKQTVRQQSSTNHNNGASLNTRKSNNNINMNSKQYRESQKQMLNELKKNGNQANYNMIQNSNTVLQRQNEIIQQNQKALHQIVNGNNNKNNTNNNVDGEAIKNQISVALDQIKNQVIEIKKMKNQIVSVAQQFNKNAADAKNNRNIPNQVSDLNSNMRNLVQISQNHIQGLQNMQALKSLQNFNIEGYTQAISTLKKQIAQYQKQSQNIERELKIRSAKLQKLELPPKFEQQLYKPYQQHLNNRIKNIDLHGIRDRVYEKIGGFDYGKFQNDINNIMGEVKGELSNFAIVCKEFQISVPDIRIDKIDLKNLDMKLPSVLDQYKAVKGIKFEDPKKQTISSQPQSQPSRQAGNLSKTAQIQARLKQTGGLSSKKPQNLQGFGSKPIDLAHQTQLKKQSDKRPTILENQQKKEKRQHEQRMKKGSKQKKQQNQEFNKYLQNRAREELELLYKQKKQNLQRMQKQLHDQIQNPVFIDLNLNRQKVQPHRNPTNVNKQQPKKKLQQKEQQQQYEQQFEAQSEKDKEPGKQIIQQQPKDPQHADIKELGRQILKQKLKNILGQKNKPQQQHIVRPNNFMPNSQQQNINMNGNGDRQMLNIAEGFMNMINNTLTQVNNNLAKSIQKKIQRSSPQSRPRSIQRRQIRKIQVPKLQAFRPPPVFNMNLVQQPSVMPSSFMPMSMPVAPPRQIQVPKKIVVEDYNQYRLKNQDNYQDYQISSQDDDDV